MSDSERVLTDAFMQAVPYLPSTPATVDRPIGLVGCGGISVQHLTNYRDAGFNVVALADVLLERAESRRDEFYPDADVYTDYRELLARTDIEVIDIATHVDVRPAIVQDALRSGKHVLSQKPFVLDIEEGEQLCSLAEELGLRLAVNQNGRWAPHFSYLRSVVDAGLIGEVTSADFAVYWGHDDDFADNPAFNTMEDLILYDFGIHWFDMVANVFKNQDTATEIVAMHGHRPGQRMSVPTQAQVLINYPAAQASLIFRGASQVREQGSYEVHGTKGSLVHVGGALGGNTVWWKRRGEADVKVEVEGTWWSNGMRGSMAELLVALDEGRTPLNDARTSIAGLSLCFAAIDSSRRQALLDPASVRTLRADV